MVGMCRVVTFTTVIMLIASVNVAASMTSMNMKPESSTFIGPQYVYKQTVEYVYNFDRNEQTPLISAIITSFDGDGNVTAIELKDRENMTMTERVLEDLSREIIFGNEERQIVSVRYELNMVGDPISADIMYLDIID